MNEWHSHPKHTQHHVHDINQQDRTGSRKDSFHEFVSYANGPRGVKHEHDGQHAEGQQHGIDDDAWSSEFEHLGDGSQREPFKHSVDRRCDRGGRRFECSHQASDQPAEQTNQDQRSAQLGMSP